MDIDRIRELQDLSNPAAPFNQPDAEYCHIHNHEMQVVEGEDEDGMYCFSFCEICQAIENNQVQCSICKTDKVEWDSEMEEWYCLHCEHFTELVEDVCSE